jgi:ribosome modulation factor
VTCKHWHEDPSLTKSYETLKRLREEGYHAWGICLGPPTSRKICPYENFETRDDFGCVEHEKVDVERGLAGSLAFEVSRRA